jgi:thiol-disulfide isomerase/thioredoxin
VAVLLCAAGLWLASLLPSDADGLKGTTELAPSLVLSSLALPSVGGTELDPATLRGKVVIVHFFATWCEPCREELPALQRLAARSGLQQMAVVAISVGEVESRVRRFAQSTPLDFPILLDQDRRAAKAWNISELPSTVILDSDLRPRLAVEGEFAWDQIDPRMLAGMLDPNHTFSKPQPIH